MDLSQTVAGQTSGACGLPRDVVDQVVRLCPRDVVGVLRSVSKEFRRSVATLAVAEPCPIRVGSLGPAQLRWAVLEGSLPESFFDERLFAEVAGKCDLSTVARLYMTRCPMGYSACAAAARSGRLPTLKWLRRAVSCPWDLSTCEGAAESGHIDVLEWAVENGAQIGPSTVARAASSGCVDVIRWLRARGCHWNASACASAAREGRLSTLKWLRQSGCPWDEMTCACAASNGYVHVLSYARMAGCPWDKTSCDAAVMGGHLETLRWLMAAECPCDLSLCWCAASCNQVAILQWALDNGFAWDWHVLDIAALHGKMGGGGRGPSQS